MIKKLGFLNNQIKKTLLQSVVCQQSKQRQQNSGERTQQSLHKLNQLMNLQQVDHPILIDHLQNYFEVSKQSYQNHKVVNNLKSLLRSHLHPQYDYMSGEELEQIILKDMELIKYYEDCSFKVRKTMKSEFLGFIADELNNIMRQKDRINSESIKVINTFNFLMSFVSRSKLDIKQLYDYYQCIIVDRVLNKQILQYFNIALIQTRQNNQEKHELLLQLLKGNFDQIVDSFEYYQIPLLTVYLLQNYAEEGELIGRLQDRLQDQLAQICKQNMRVYAMYLMTLCVHNPRQIDIKSLTSQLNFKQRVKLQKHYIDFYVDNRSKIQQVEELDKWVLGCLRNYRNNIIDDLFVESVTRDHELTNQLADQIMFYVNHGDLIRNDLGQTIHLFNLIENIEQQSEKVRYVMQRFQKVRLQIVLQNSLGDLVCLLSVFDRCGLLDKDILQFYSQILTKKVNKKNSNMKANHADQILEIYSRYDFELDENMRRSLQKIRDISEPSSD